jgi:thiamine biosynthesis protein ThiS
MTRPVALTINGEERLVANVRSLSDLLAHLGLDRRAVVVEHNRVIVRRDALDDAVVADGDVVEIVHFVGGG